MSETDELLEGIYAILDHVIYRRFCSEPSQMSDNDVRSLAKQITEKARELMAEEEKEKPVNPKGSPCEGCDVESNLCRVHCVKPTAPAGLVEELAKYFKDDALTGTWYWGLWKPKDKEEALRWYAETLDKGSGVEQHIVMCGTGDNERIICVTGNGPHSEAHAKLITQLPQILSKYPKQSTAPKGLIEEIREWFEKRWTNPKAVPTGVVEEFYKIISRYKPEQSLSELADEKGFWFK